MYKFRLVPLYTALVGTLLFLCCSTLTWAQGQAASCTPGITFASLLGSIGIDYTTGKLQMGSLYALCLPTPSTPSDSSYPYDPDSGGKLSTVLKRGDGTPLTTYVWYASSISSLWELTNNKVIGGSSAIVTLSAGQYLLEFQLEGTPFYRFPFSVTTLPSDDPYQVPGTCYFIEGVWNDIGNLFYQRNDPESAFRFTTWLRDKHGNEKKQSLPYEVFVVRDRDGKRLAEDASTLRLEPRWQKVDFLFHPAGGDKNSYVKAGDILREDGSYSVQLTLAGKRYGLYHFTIHNGRIELQGRQLRDRTDPMEAIVESVGGGRYTSWWISRENSK